MKAGTFTQIYIHIVFAVKRREKLIHPKWEETLYKYITGIIQNQGHKLLAINGMPDHLHILIGMKPSCNLSDLVKEIKRSSTVWIQENRYVAGKFQWQDGYGAFSYSHSSLNNVISYIENQKKHHRTRRFKEEYEEFMKKFEIEYKKEFLFDED